MNRNLLILSISQALAFSSAPLIVFIGGMIGADLAPEKSLATLPVAFMVVGVALFTIPSSMFMKRFGRRAGFITGAFLATAASLLAMYAISTGSFTLFCAATLSMGSNLAFVQQYRFAVTESVTEKHSSMAVSTVLLGGVFAGFFGPELGKRLKDWLSFGEYSGSFAGLAILHVGLIFLLLFLVDIKLPPERLSGEERPLSTVVRQPTFLIALFSAVAAYGCMSLLMTATPLQMTDILSHSLADAGFVIQSHAIAMYLPSLFTGLLIAKLGVVAVMSSGVLLLLATVVLTLSGQGLPHFWLALVLLGVGWNFLFISGTVLLTQSYRPVERFKAQAVNDFLVFGAQALASLSAGAVLFRTGWNGLALLTLPILVSLSIFIFWYHRSTQHKGLATPVSPESLPGPG